MFVCVTFDGLLGDTVTQLELVTAVRAGNDFIGIENDTSGHWNTGLEMFVINK